MICECTHCINNYLSVGVTVLEHERIWSIFLRNTYILGFQPSLILIQCKHSRGEKACHCVMEYYEDWVFQSSMNIWKTLCLCLSLYSRFSIHGISSFSPNELISSSVHIEMRFLCSSGFGHFNLMRDNAQTYAFKLKA